MSDDRGKKADAIRQELKNYSWNTIQLFEEIFPCSDDKGLVEVYTKEYFEGQDTFPYYVSIASAKDFWDRWDRFKNLRAFL